MHSLCSIGRKSYKSKINRHYSFEIEIKYYLKSRQITRFYQSLFEGDQWDSSNTIYNFGFGKNSLTKVFPDVRLNIEPSGRTSTVEGRVTSRDCYWSEPYMLMLTRCSQLTAWVNHQACKSTYSVEVSHQIQVLIKKNEVTSAKRGRSPVEFVKRGNF